MQKAAEFVYGYAPRPAYSAPEFEVEPLDVTSAVGRLFLVEHQHQSQRVDNVSPRLQARAALADRARNTFDACDDPPVFVRLAVRDRQP